MEYRQWDGRAVPAKAGNAAGGKPKVQGEEENQQEESAALRKKLRVVEKQKLE